jgi:hypothetical protein
MFNFFEHYRIQKLLRNFFKKIETASFSFGPWAAVTAGLAAVPLLVFL